MCVETKKGDHNCKRGDYDDGAIESRNDDDVMCVCYGGGWCCNGCT